MPIEQFEILGETAIVTGGSAGIGRTIAHHFASDGLNVVICSRKADRVEPTAEQINEDLGSDRVKPVVCDVTDREQVQAMVDETLEAFGGLDILVNNAGASFMAPFADISENGWKKIIDINLHGTYQCTQACLDALSDGGGFIVNMSSMAGVHGSENMTHYAASKAAIINFTRSIAAEMAEHQIRVNCIAPGFIATKGLASQMGVSGEDIDRDDVDRQMGRTEEVADVVQFLVSPAASFMQGETLRPHGVPWTGKESLD